ncbi:unnamed protein product [Prunus armeniaca]|uniref:Uncharacterized protein n=1 Tax=Prunus armeniaca TaxID=36596 RepID=A0A6J5TRP9_PRUAR|nr:unnamed protein product [Prunus armeniaca]
MDNKGIMDLIEWLQCNDDQSPSLMNKCDLICASLEAVDPFLAIFEDGIAPIHVSCYIEPVLGLGKVLILPAKPRDGQLSRVVMVTLPRDEEACIHHGGDKRPSKPIKTGHVSCNHKTFNFADH